MQLSLTLHAGGNTFGQHMRRCMDLTYAPHYGGAPGKRRRRVLAAILLALSLTGAPLLGAVEPGCELCPRNCPMHQHLDGHHEAHPQRMMKCHNAPGAGAHAPNTSRQPRVTRTSCRAHAVAAPALPPIVLPDRIRWIATDAFTPAADREFPIDSRTNDPPEQPPPIIVT